MFKHKILVKQPLLISSNTFSMETILLQHLSRSHSFKDSCPLKNLRDKYIKVSQKKKKSQQILTRGPIAL